MPEMRDGRYASALIIDNDHYAPIDFYDPCVHGIPADSSHMFAAVRVQLYNPNDLDEIALVSSLQRQFVITAASATPLPAFNWETGSLNALRSQYEVEAPAFANRIGDGLKSQHLRGATLPITRCLHPS